MRSWLIITVVCVIVAVGTTASYHFVHPEWVSYRRGEQHFAAAQYADAATCYQDALQHGLKPAQACFRLAETQLILGRNDAAAETAYAFIRSTNIAPATLYSFSEQFTAHGQFKVSVQLLDQLVAANPDNRKARFRLAQVLAWTQQFERAIEQYRVLLGE